MAPNVHQQAQRSQTNLYRFRRLKWGGPPSRFKVANVLRAKTLPSQATPVETPQEVPVVHLDWRKRGWSPVDVALLVCIGVSCIVIAVSMLN